MNKKISDSTNREQQNELSDSYASENNISASSGSVRAGRRSRQISQQIETEPQSSRVIIINPQTIRKESTSISDTENGQFSSNAKKYGVDESMSYVQNILKINLNRVRDLMTEHQTNKQRLKDLYNINKKVANNQQYYESYPEQSQSRQASDVNQLLIYKQAEQSHIEKYSLKDIIFSTSTGPIFSQPKNSNNEEEKPEFMHQFGGAIVLYFKTLKLLAYCMAFLASISLFQIYLNTSINYTDHNSQRTKILDKLFISTSIAPIASINRVCDIVNITQTTQSYDYTFFCPQGSISVDSIIFSKIYIGSGLECQLFDPFIDINPSIEWKQNYDNIKDQCDGKRNCTLNLFNTFIYQNFQDDALYYITNSCQEGINYNYQFLKIILIYDLIFLKYGTLKFFILDPLQDIFYFKLNSLNRMKINFNKLRQTKMVISSMYTLEIAPFNFIETKNLVMNTLWDFVEDIVVDELDVSVDDLIVVDINFSQSPTIYIKLQEMKKLVKKRDINIAKLLSQYEQIFNLQKKTEISLTELRSYTQILPENKQLDRIIKNIVKCQDKIILIAENQRKRNLDCHQVFDLSYKFIAFQYSIYIQQADFAWITFDSIQKKEIFEQKMKRMNCCGFDNREKFYQKHLRVRKTHASDNIIWDNLQMPGFKLFFRRFISFMITLIVFVSANVGIGFIRSEEKIQEYQYQQESSSESLGFLITIFMVDKLLKFINKKLTKFEKYKTHSSESRVLIKRLFYIEILNIILILMISNMVYSYISSAKTGVYKFIWIDQFFFISVVKVIALKLFIDLFKHPFSVLFHLGLKKFLQYYDRKFQGSVEVSRTLLFEDWINLYTYDDFPLEKRYSQILVSFFSAFMFGSAVPILYVFLFIYLVILFWFDKIYFLRFSKRPKIQESQSFEIFYTIIKDLFPMMCLTSCVFFGSPVLFNIEKYFSNPLFKTNMAAYPIFAPIYRTFFGINITSIFSIIYIVYIAHFLCSLFIKNPIEKIKNSICLRKEKQKIVNQHSTQSFLEFCNDSKILKLKKNLEKKYNQSSHEQYKQKISRVMEHIDSIQIRSTVQPRNKSMIGSIEYDQNDK